MLCAFCRKEIGNSQKTPFLNIETGMVYYYHLPDCTEEVTKFVTAEYVWLIWKIKQKVKGGST